MLVTTLLGILVLCEVSVTIKVPTEWHDGYSDNDSRQDEVQTFIPHTLQQKKVPIEYFQYTAKKPQFAVDVAAFHGGPSPENLYKSYPVRPHTEKLAPDLGKHRILEPQRPSYSNLQRYTHKNQELGQPVAPVSSEYDVYHPYKAEQPALQEIYKDPILDKIRNDIRDSKNKLQNYENEAGKPNIENGEYLESLEETDRKKFPHANVPATYEIHRPLRRPVYYRAPPFNPHREQVLNKRFRHPWNQYVKIRPQHYRPLKNHIQRLRQNHALKYDDEQNEYPQVPQSEPIEEPQDGYDIYEKGKAKFVQLRNNIDENLNRVVTQNRPPTYERLEMQNNDDSDSDEEEEFVPIKNYAQVRRTETTRHLPRKAALEEANSYEELRNAPRLREAVKSTKAQTVYTEEGYEDAAYDHAGEQKYASDHEAHGGYLKEHELSGGKYKAPSVAAKFQDGSGSVFGTENLHGEKWKNNDKDTVDDAEAEDFIEDEREKTEQSNVRHDNSPNIESASQSVKHIEQKKLDYDDEDLQEYDDVNSSNGDNVQKISEHDVNKREAKFKVPNINITSTFLSKDEIEKIGKIKEVRKINKIKTKYPYYLKNIHKLPEHSPLRYAENMKFIPKKSRGGTEFYDSRSVFECSEVLDEVDPIPENIKNKKNSESDDDDDEKASEEKEEADFKNLKKSHSLKGLGEKIDCFKAKYFGKNPLDSPFFKEDLIPNPEPIFSLNIPPKLTNPVSRNQDIKPSTRPEVFDPFEKLKQWRIDKAKSQFIPIIYQNLPNIAVNSSILNDSVQTTQQTNVYTDVISNIKSYNLQTPLPTETLILTGDLLNSTKDIHINTNISYDSYQNKEDVTHPPLIVRKKRAAPFKYEPYKIIRDSHAADSKKITTINISPLIKKLQTSRIVDNVNNKTDSKQPVKRNISTRTYKDIGKEDRDMSTAKADSDMEEKSFVDVNEDQRRGEPRYEMRPTNHKTEYTPVENKKTMTLDDYHLYAKNSGNSPKHKNSKPSVRLIEDSHLIKTTQRPIFDISEYLPKTTTQRHRIVSNVRKSRAMPVSNQENKNKRPINTKDDESEEDDEYEEYEEDEITTTTTTSTKPVFRRRLRSSTTNKPPPEENQDQPQRLRLVTRFRDTVPAEKHNPTLTTTPTPTVSDSKEINATPPKYREKKRKSSKSTLMTDTKTYGDPDDVDDMKKEEVDALIGIKQNMDDYTPQYEKQEEIREKEEAEKSSGSSEDSDEEDDDEEDESDGEEDENSSSSEEDEDDEDDEEEKPEVTTSEPTKRTLLRTTETPPSTTETRSANLKLRPIVKKKKIEIHKELPLNHTSPHLTQFKQDIKEVEIIKELPMKSKLKPRKNVEALELYKDDNLAKEVNKLGAVEVFRENLDLRKGPKHGGNYKNAQIVEETDKAKRRPIIIRRVKSPRQDTAAQTTKAQLIELDDTTSQTINNGNVRRAPKGQDHPDLLGVPKKPNSESHDKRMRESTSNNAPKKSAKIIELEEQDYSGSSESNEDEDYTNSRNRGETLHGGNYRSSQIVEATDDDKTVMHGGNLREIASSSKGSKKNAADLLNSFAQAVPVLTTTPAYILDPSKRMYYYVDVK